MSVSILIRRTDLGKMINAADVIGGSFCFDQKFVRCPFSFNPEIKSVSFSLELGTCPTFDDTLRGTLHPAADIERWIGK